MLPGLETRSEERNPTDRSWLLSPSGTAAQTGPDREVAGEVGISPTVLKGFAFTPLLDQPHLRPGNKSHTPNKYGQGVRDLHLLSSRSTFLPDGGPTIISEKE